MAESSLFPSNSLPLYWKSGKHLFPLAVLSCVLFPSLASALALGDVKIFSKLSEPLRAQIQLRHVGNTGFDDIQVHSAGQQDAQRMQLEWNPVLAQIHFEPKLDASGQPVIELTSERPITDPYLTLLLSVNWPDGQLTKEYNLLFDPASAPAKHAQEIARVKPAKHNATNIKSTVTSPINTGSTESSAEGVKSAEAAQAPTVVAEIPAETNKTVNDTAPQSITTTSETSSVLAKETSAETKSVSSNAQIAPAMAPAVTKPTHVQSKKSPKIAEKIPLHAVTKHPKSGINVASAVNTTQPTLATAGVPISVQPSAAVPAQGAPVTTNPVATSTDVVAATPMASGASAVANVPNVSVEPSVTSTAPVSGTPAANESTAIVGTATTVTPSATAVATGSTAAVVPVDMNARTAEAAPVQPAGIVSSGQPQPGVNSNVAQTSAATAPSQATNTTRVQKQSTNNVAMVGPAQIPATVATPAASSSTTPTVESPSWFNQHESMLLLGGFALLALGLGGAWCYRHRRDLLEHINLPFPWLQAEQKKEPSLKEPIILVQKEAPVFSAPKKDDAVDVLEQAEIYLSYGRTEKAIHVLQTAFANDTNRFDIALQLLSTYKKMDIKPAYTTLYDQLASQLDTLPANVVAKIGEINSRPFPSALPGKGEFIKDSDPAVTTLDSQHTGVENDVLEFEHVSLDTLTQSQTSTNKENKNSNIPKPDLEFEEL